MLELGAFAEVGGNGDEQNPQEQPTYVSAGQAALVVLKRAGGGGEVVVERLGNGIGDGPNKAYLAAEVGLRRGGELAARLDDLCELLIVLADT